MYLKLEVQTSCPNNDFDEYRKKKEWIVQNHTITMQKKTENLSSSIGQWPNAITFFESSLFIFYNKYRELMFTALNEDE